MRNPRRVWLLVGVFCLGIVWTIWAATWMGFWGGQSLYPGTERYEKGRWEKPPICYQFLDTPAKSWTDDEKTAARGAIREWNLRLGIMKESTDPQCMGRESDVVLLWAADDFFKDDDFNRDGKRLWLSGAAAVYIPICVAPPLNWEPCPDLQTAKILDRCSVIAFRLRELRNWFVDPTPDSDEEFAPQDVQLCGVLKKMLKAKPGGPAFGKQDFYTIVLHEFGHALGLIHSGGCDRNLFTPSPPTDPKDDDGSVMWEGVLRERREFETPASHLSQSERRHLTESDEVLLGGPGGLYCPDLTVSNLIVRAVGPGSGPWTLTVTAGVQNVGNIPAGPFVVTVTRNSQLVVEQEFEGLEPGASARIFATEIVGAGLHLIEVRVDSRDHVTECDEGNNVASRFVRLGK
uniref:CARDB domain-containing protein n=2 Tax=Candidatus Bipolaricaulota TaxID=67810 RepID=H5SNH9_9BACT|nr:hypothetical protein HGMM_F52A12C35 [uncultured Acetothermia bacterium]BAL59399.1 hypothetical protein HGMM_OP4C035 [Candidatus Acetothermum autotrophicum]